jgi:hypothetical protein
MKAFLVCLSIWASACASVGGNWRNDELRRQAASDLACASDALSIYESSTAQYSVRGCGKRALYRRDSCNRVTRECRYVLDGQVTTN